ncbi:MAG: IS481 family transposase, partial [Erysipelotrichales bacterium]
ISNTIDFIHRAFKYFGYYPKIIQTDNGTEFAYNTKTKQVHPLKLELDELGIIHQKIRPRTPEHNGKVERSHRNDNQRFYRFLSFFSLEDLNYQGKLYLKRSNNIPMAVLDYRTPKEQRSHINKKL